jgi:hypothetical protein
MNATAQGIDFIAAAKACLALETGDRRWATMRPPLRRATDAAVQELRDVILNAR